MLVIFVGILNRANKPQSRFKQEWIINFGKRFHAGFTDSVEILLFVFFLTMDSTKLFFLGNDLNHALTAQIGGYDLMHRGINLKDTPGITVGMIVATVSIEILRIIIKLIAMAKLHYSNLMIQEIEIDVIRTKHVRVKESIQMAFTESKDNLTRFITFNTVLLLVFLFFPRLKLMTLVVASITGFILDVSMKGRLTISKSNDLISRMLSKAFKI
jgi:hypothetical protein